MPPLLLLLIACAGLGGLVYGAHLLVTGASSMATRAGVSQIAIGLTVVAFGTSLPEMAVNVFSSAQGQGDIVFGNIIGSNIFNTLLILGFSGLVCPLAVLRDTVWKEIPFSVLVGLMLAAMVNGWLVGQENVLSRLDSLLLLTFFVGFLFYVWRMAKVEPGYIDGQTAAHVQASSTSILYIIGGLAALFIGGRVVVDASVEAAMQLGISQKLIAVTLIAGGTSLPEMATSVVAAFKKKYDIAVGNIVGSNIFNIVLILGVSGLIRPVSYDLAFNTDLLVYLAGAMMLFVAMFLGKRHRLDRWEAALMLAGFVAYTIYLVHRR